MFDLLVLHVWQPVIFWLIRVGWCPEPLPPGTGRNGGSQDLTEGRKKRFWVYIDGTAWIVLLVDKEKRGGKSKYGMVSSE